MLKEISALLFTCGVSARPFTVSSHGAGGNNQTYKVEANGQLFLLKRYYSLDRLQAEYRFLQYAGRVAPEYVPKVYGKIDGYNMGLYEYLDGEKVTHIGEREIEGAIDFFSRLNHPESKIYAQDLGEAKEACFSLRDHVDLVKGRIVELQQIPETSQEATEAKEIAYKLERLLPIFDDPTPLSVEDRCISPSDFGFHNALRTKIGALYFFDFEYGGWDDPGKMVGDFFSQIAGPIPYTFFPLFTEKTLRSKRLIERAKQLLPLYRIKWCTIVLNIFLPYHLHRRKFAGNRDALTLLQRKQLEKVKHYGLY